MNLNYWVSERFIHDDLINRSQATVDKIYEIWRRDENIPPFLFTWPAEAIKTDDGEKLDNMCTLQLPEKKEERSRAMHRAVERTKAYALLLGEQNETDIKIIFESPNGARCWTIPILRSGDVRYLGDAKITDDKENVGLLWSKQRAVA